ncbi:23S rRNA (cytidine(2498)-2'-O)-methyltransferase RlmM [Zooshikella harenae]|uniref:Ribosomal RNA large subunit methyltransferase M n=1 Tax=Zooshikella harenae TaxID=2827238 RepID=A0ABS5Z6Z3_9GAMM|nr:23S rRNA (cytidine(2498)-2'-O)-methyltransferase RlmM [Zooshikella harenae]MBU2709826.1 23S rRNA (cytidine(2498)-2'-O)-methyltransferase RlmM [Zooshikella harenae]
MKLKLPEPFTHLVLYCRAGFEKECAAEITAVSASLGVAGYVQAKPQQGFVVFHCLEGEEKDACWLQTKISLDALVFTRQWLAAGPFLDDLPPTDRLTPILEVIEGWPHVGQLWLEYPDTNEGKQLHRFCKKLTVPLRKALKAKKVLSEQENTQLPSMHLFFLNGQQCYVGINLAGRGARWFNGIPRLKFPSQAPSRSTLKLAEAWHCLLPKEDADRLLQPGMKAVDLGAAPGGWTWQLVSRHIRVTAVDNGPMDQELMESGLVEHKRADGFTFEPAKPVDWLVCDIVDKPARVTDMVIRWLTHEWTRHAVFNLKLPMKQRYQAVTAAHDRLHDAFREAGFNYRIITKQLYHDREEVTVVVLRD